MSIIDMVIFMVGPFGQAPLQFGKVRIFQDDGRGSTAFIGEDWGKFTPLDDEMRLYVGTALMQAA